MKHSGKVLKKYGKLKIIDCTKCKFIHILPLPSKKEISKLYKKKYYEKIKPQYIKKYEQEIDYWNLIFDEKLDYLKSEKIGKKIHQKRINLEMNLMIEENMRIKKEIYEKFAEIGIGRTAIIYAKKQHAN